MFRDDRNEMSREEQEEIARLKESIKQSDTVRQQSKLVIESVNNTKAEVLEKIAALKKEKASASSSGLFSHDQPTATDEPQDDPKNKKDKKGGCNIL